MNFETASNRNVALPEIASQTPLHQTDAASVFGWSILLLGVLLLGIDPAKSAEVAIRGFENVGLAAAGYGIIHSAVGLFGFGIICTTCTRT